MHKIQSDILYPFLYNFLFPIVLPIAIGMVKKNTKQKQSLSFILLVNAI